jgi:DNA-binding response OmpR family regulator
MTEDAPTVLVVDDEQEVADTYALRLREYETRTAYGGTEALEAMDHEVDVLLLDRRMPVTGDEVLREIRDRGFDVAVVMVTAVTPDAEVTDMPFDDYLCKPVSTDDLVEAVETASDARSRGESATEFFTVTSKLALLQSEVPETDLAGNDEFQRLQARAETLHAELRDAPAAVDDLLERYARLE